MRDGSTWTVSNQPNGEAVIESRMVSCLCVTEDRAAFMPWLLWGYERQTWLHRELLVVDSSAEPYRSERDDVRVVAVASGTSVPEKRNRALREARGELVAWFDDDDWQHPQRLQRLCNSLTEGVPYVGGTRSWFLDVLAGSCRRYDGRGSLIFNTALFRRNVATSVSFDVRRQRASDTPWLRELRARHPSGPLLLADDALTFWLCHDRNISNPRQRRHFDTPLARLRDSVGAAAWGETEQQLELLRSRLALA